MWTSKEFNKWTSQVQKDFQSNKEQLDDGQAFDIAESILIGDDDGKKATEYIKTKYPKCHPAEIIMQFLC